MYTAFSSFYQLNLPKYLEKMMASSPNIRQQFDDKDFAIVGSLATLDATITFGEGIKNLQVIRTDMQAGFEGLHNPENGKLHNRVQTQTGGHMGQGMTAVLEKVGIMDKLKAKWGANSLKFRSFSAAAANGLDFVMNGYNTR